MRRLRRLTEAECYARCYGTRDDLVRVRRFEPRPTDLVAVPAGELLRRLFEERLDARTEPEAA
jgi:hypothetical protein